MLEKTGSPPPAGLKNVVPKFLSVRSIVIAPAKTGTANKSKNAVINIAHTKEAFYEESSQVFSYLSIVVIKLTAPKIEEAPAK